MRFRRRSARHQEQFNDGEQQERIAEKFNAFFADAFYDAGVLFVQHGSPDEFPSEEPRENIYCQKSANEQSAGRKI